MIEIKKIPRNLFLQFWIKALCYKIGHIVIYSKYWWKISILAFKTPVWHNISYFSIVVIAMNFFVFRKSLCDFIVDWYSVELQQVQRMATITVGLKADASLQVIRLSACTGTGSNSAGADVASITLAGTPRKSGMSPREFSFDISYIFSGNILK